MLAWQLQTLALIKTAGQKPVDEIAREARLNPFVVRKSLAIASKLTLARLKDLIHELRVLDVRLKITSTDADEALKLYLLSLR
jgi:DNA polymerase III delta subunit